MSRTLLIGPAGSGKSHRLLDEFVETLRSAKDPLEESCFFILPSAEHTERVINLVLQQGLKGFFHRRVTTLSRLIPKVFGVGEERVVSNVTRFLLLGDILARNEWDYFSEIHKGPGFLNLIGSFLTELKESLISPTHFRERMNGLKKLEPDLAAKYEALAAIYETYESRIASEGLLDRQDTLRIFLETKEKGRWHRPHFKKIWLDGFFDFSDLQLAYLRELSEMTEEMTVSLTMDTNSSRERLFEPAVRTAEILSAMGFKTEYLKAGFHRGRVPALHFLERQIFCDERKQPLTPTLSPQAGRGSTQFPLSPQGRGQGEGSPITLFEAIGVQGEIEMIARQIETLYQSGGYRFSDFAILLRQIGSYESVIRSVFARFDIPVEIHERERLSHSPLIQTIVSLLKIFRDGWRRPDLIRFFKSSYVTSLGEIPKSYEWACELEHRAYREGVSQGREEWLKSWTGQPGDKGLAEFDEEKRKGLASLCQLEDAFRASGKFSEMRQLLLGAVRKTFRIFAVQDSMAESVRRDAAGIGRLEAILEEIRIHLAMRGTEETSFEEYTDQFFRLVDLDLYSLHLRDKNRVQVYGVSLARQKEYRVVFVAGLLEKGFPLQVREDPLLSDWERRLFSTASGPKLRERLPRQNVERYLFYLAVTRASEKLFLTCPRLDLEGKESLPSFYLEEVKSLFGGALEDQTKKQNLSHPYPEISDSVTRRELETAVMGELWNPIAPHAAKQSSQTAGELSLLLFLTNHLLGDERARDKIRKAFHEIRAELTDPAIREGGYFRSRETSATRLEEYAKCPYKYFANRVLQLKDPNDEINIKLKGTILHQVLENYFRHRSENPKDPFDKEKALRFVLKELEAALRKYPLIVEKRYQFELDHEELVEMLGRFLDIELERLKTSGLQPRYFEFGFGSKKKDDAPPLEVVDGERKILITGKVDRIDVDKDSRYGLVIDYKRSVQFSRSDLDLGVALQLPVYLSAVEKYLKLKPVGGEFYSLRERKKKGFYHADHAAAFSDLPPRAQKFSDEEFYKTLEKSMDYIRRFTRGMENVEIPVKPRVCESYCPYSSVCRIEKWKLPSILEEIKEEDSQCLTSN